MEEYINQLIDIDDIAKGMINLVEKESINMDEMVENELEKQKSKIDATINMKLRLKKDDLDSQFKEFKDGLDIETNKKIEKIKQEYQNKKDEQVQKIVNNIINN